MSGTKLDTYFVPYGSHIFFFCYSQTQSEINLIICVDSKHTTHIQTQTQACNTFLKTYPSDTHNNHSCRKGKNGEKKQ